MPGKKEQILNWVVLIILVAVRTLRQHLATGLGEINWLGNGLLVVGWVIGHGLGELDHVFYALMCNPQELSCTRVRGEIANRRWRSAWRMLKETEAERTRLPVHNVLTGLIVAVMAIWVVTSSGSMLASGVALGLSVRLLLEFWSAADYGKWYWLFARQFSPKEHDVIKWVWGLLVAVSLVGLAR